jgi:hypothetical protein
MAVCRNLYFLRGPMREVFFQPARRPEAWTADAWGGAVIANGYLSARKRNLSGEGVRLRFREGIAFSNEACT